MADNHGSNTAPLPRREVAAVKPGPELDLRMDHAHPSQTTDMGGFLPTFLTDIIGGEKIEWGMPQQIDDESVASKSQTLPELDDYKVSPFISVTLNGENILIHLPTSEVVEDIIEVKPVTQAMDLFPARRNFDACVTMIIPFDTSKDQAWNSYEYDVRVSFMNDVDVRSFFLGTLKGGLEPAPIFNEKILFKPTKVQFTVTTRKWKSETESEISARPDVDSEKLISAILKLLELKCVTGSGPIKATRLRSDIKETSSNELIIAGLKEAKWTEFLKKLHDMNLLYMTTKGQENWVSLHPHDKEECTSFINEKRNIAACMEALLSESHPHLAISDVMDKLFTHPMASTELWKMMSPNWKTLRRILMRDDAQDKGIHLDPCGDGCVVVSL